MSYVYGSKCKSRCLFSCQHLDRISDILFSRVFCDGCLIIASFSWRQRRDFFMFCSRRVLVLAFPRGWWVRCSCLLGAICVWIKQYYLSSFCWLRKVCGYIFFVSGFSPLLQCITWLICWFFSGSVQNVFFFVGSFLVGGMFLYPYSCIVCWSVWCCGSIRSFCCGFLWFETCY